MGNGHNVKESLSDIRYMFTVDRLNNLQISGKTSDSASPGNPPSITISQKGEVTIPKLNSDLNTEISELKLANEQLKKYITELSDKLTALSEEIVQIKRDNERFDTMDKYYSSRELHITQLLDIDNKKIQ
jgi:predicted RNase H-like nuclease (RuvC/YqgF family)